MTINYASTISPETTPQSEPLIGSAQVPNSAGGYAFAVDDWTRLDRFLILGSEGGSYYATERKLTRENAEAVLRVIALDGVKVVDRVVEISVAGRAPKNDPALFVLALVTAYGNVAAKSAANTAIPLVARIGTHFFHLLDYVTQFRGLGRGVKRGLSNWYIEQEPNKLIEQLFKYQSRDGWSHADALQVLHPTPPTPAHGSLFALVDELRRRGRGHEARDLTPLLSGLSETELEKVEAFLAIKSETDVAKAAKLISEFRLPREVVPTELLTNATIWEALLPHMGITALIRSLATLTRVGLLTPLSAAERTVKDKLSNVEILKRGRVHPIHVLTALLTYRAGHGIKGSTTWTPLSSITDALNDTFYKTFELITPTNKRIVLALDVSGSMGTGVVAGVPGLTPRMASAALAMVTARTEPNYVIVGFTEGAAGNSRMYGRNSGISTLDISPTQRLDAVVNTIDRRDFGGTDCALPMIWAEENKINADAFLIYTDSETWAGNVHPPVALRNYRHTSGIAAKLGVVGMVANNFTIADPNDAGMLDVVGFDTATPALLADFISGGIAG